MTSMMPKAFCGYGIDTSRNGLGLFVRVCAWCDDKKEMDQWAAERGTPTSHAICPACYQDQLSARLGENTSPK